MNILDLMDDYSIDGDYILYETVEGKKRILDIFKQLYNQCRTVKICNDVEQAKIILGVGRGYKAQNGIDDLKSIAQKLNAAIAGTRPLEDMKILNSQQVIGKTAKSARPDVYIAFGISGSVQHMGNIKADTIIAINNNKNSAIFRHATHKILGDARDIAHYINSII